MCFSIVHIVIFVLKMSFWFSNGHTMTSKSVKEQQFYVWMVANNACCKMIDCCLTARRRHNGDLLPWKYRNAEIGLIEWKASWQKKSVFNSFSWKYRLVALPGGRKSELELKNKNCLPKMFTKKSRQRYREQEKGLQIRNDSTSKEIYMTDKRGIQIRK